MGMMMMAMMMKPSSIQPEEVKSLELISFKVGRKRQNTEIREGPGLSLGGGRGGQMKHQTPE